MANILITGIAGGLSQRVAAKLLASGHSVVGVDYREVRSPLPPSLDKLKVVRAHYNKTIIEDIFRRLNFNKEHESQEESTIKEETIKPLSPRTDLPSFLKALD